MKAKAFAPGHISGFFEPVFQSQNIDRSGSRGSGINISFGANTIVTAESSTKQNIDILLNNKQTNAPVTELAVKYLVGNQHLKIQVNTTLDLPMGQGFGMSGAGALSATYALAEILNISREQAIKASHYAEVQLYTGLGDVLASSFGGIEIRREAGLPPWGVIEHIPGNYEIVLCIIGKELITKDILTDSSKINDITNYGRYCMKKLLEKPSVDNLFSLSQVFTKKTGLADKKILNAIEAAKNYGIASMCMLGNSIFALGKTNELCKTLSTFGKVYICTVDQNGARIIEER
jgi:pantoate kinase